MVNQQRMLETQSRLKELQQANQLFLQVIESRRAEGYEKDLLKIITDYTNTWFVLNQYDTEQLKIEDVSKRKPSALDYEGTKKNRLKI